MKPGLLAASLFLLAIGAGPCGDSSKPQTFAGEGTVMQGVGPECPATWHVRTDVGGNILWPVENPTFQKEGMRVKFTARARPDMASICMAGTMVEFTSMEAK